MSNVFNRRSFLKTTGVTGLGLALGFVSSASESTVYKLDTSLVDYELNPFVLISSTGEITLVNSRPDMGQGSYQAVPSILAEELEVSLDQVNIIPSDGRAQYGSQQSGGSSTVRELWGMLRKAGASAKEMLIQAAANKWGVQASTCYASNGKVFTNDGSKNIGYGELVVEASKLEVPKSPKLKDPSQYKILGKYAKRQDVPSKVTGKAVFGIDVVVPGMMYAAIVHSPSVKAKLLSVDDAEAKKIIGVKHIVRTNHEYPGGQTEAIAVVADTYWAALKGCKALKLSWDDKDFKQTLNSESYFKAMHTASETKGIRAEESGDFDVYFDFAKNKLEAVYETPFLAHAAIEPVNATAHVKEDGTVEVWAPIQGPDGALNETAALLNVSKEKIKIHPTLLGGSFGRKAFMDFMKEAIDISRQIKAPVKLIWSREEDMAQGPYRPAMLSKMRGALGKNNSIEALSHHSIGESIQGQHWNSLQPFEAETWIAGELSKENHKYNIPIHHLAYSRVKTEIPILWWRSVYASNFAWGQECFIDELAIKAGKDPITMRKDLLNDSVRDQKVITKLDEILNGYAPLPKDHARGVAMFRSFSTMSAAAVEVARAGNGIKIIKVTSVIDCGQHVNPDMVKAQTEGNIVMGLSAAIKGGITFSDGRCDQSNFHDYQVMRLNEMPAVDIHIMENLEKPGGVGEPGLPPIAPALGNAIFNLTGKRLRKLPIDITSIS